MSDLSSIRFGPLTLRDIIWLCTLLGTAFAGYFAFERRLTLSEERLKGYAVHAEKLGDTVDKLNHFTTATEEVAKMNERRISSLEANFNVINPKLERIDTNIQWLTRQRSPDK